MSEIRNASYTKLTESETAALHFCIGNYHNRVKFGTVEKLDEPELLEMSFIDRSINSVHLAKGRNAPYHSPPVPIVMVRGT